MSLFQCQLCGCAENTALSYQGFAPMAKYFDWAGLEDLKGKLLCSACGPIHHSDGTPTEKAGWHGRFPRVFLPLGMFKTNSVGNLAHIETGDEDFRKYGIAREEGDEA
ncbi:hypothetical protein D3C84_324350 [compost metagenome]